MYSDKKKHSVLYLAIVAAVAVAALLLILSVVRPDLEVANEGMEAVREAVQRSARQCFAVEGVYPPNLKYLEDNYGLCINEKDYYIEYTAFASNLPPTVKVVAK